MPGNKYQALASALLRRCCVHAGCRDGDHECDRLTPAAPYQTLTDPGSLAPVGPLGDDVQRRIETIAGPLRHGHSVRLLLNGADTFAAMMALIADARVELLVENFIFRTDVVGNEFANQLRRKAEMGVEVRVLHDPVGSIMTRRLPVGFRLAGSRVQVRAFNPPRPSLTALRLGRDHRKATVADRRSFVAGGICLADVWAGNCVESCTWRDSAVMVSGRVTNDVARSFEDLWGHSLSLRPLRWGSARGPRAEPSPRVGDVPVRMIHDRGRSRATEAVLIEAIAVAQSTIFVTNPYFLPTKRLRSALIAAAQRGVLVRVLIPRRNNHPIVAWSAEPGMGSILEAGIDVWLWSGPLIHAKTVVIDGSWCLIGSSNLDPLSLRRNCELNVEIHGSAFGRQLASAFEADLERSDRFTLQHWLGRSPGRRALTAIASWLTPAL